jgi:hypothetical protein
MVLSTLLPVRMSLPLPPMMLSTLLILSPSASPPDPTDRAPFKPRATVTPAAAPR